MFRSRTRLFSVRSAILRRFLKKTQDTLVLDYGAGNGKWSFYLEHVLGYDVIGIDISKNAIKLATKNKKRLKSNCQFIVCDGRKLPLRDSSLPAIFSTDVLGHIPKVDEAIKEISRVLRKEGIAAILTETNGYYSKLTYQNYVIRIIGEDPWIWKDGHIGLCSYEYLQKIMEKEGLKVNKNLFFPFNHLLFILTYPDSDDMLYEKYPQLNKSFLLRIVRSSAHLREKSIVYKNICSCIQFFLGRIFMTLSRLDCGGVFLKLEKLG